MRFKSINPFTNDLIEEFQGHSAQDVQLRLQKADECFQAWRKTDFRHRGQLMKKAGEILRNNKTSYAKTITLEMGKPIKESVSEIEKCAWVCDYYAEMTQEFLADTSVQTDADNSYIKFDPLGPILAIMPWNFPFWQVFRFAAPALMAGNVGLLKHASNVTRCALHIEDIFREAGFPEGCFQSLILESKNIEGVIEHPIIKAVTLTGSEHAGSQVAATAGKNIKKSVLELGGSNAFIVLDDANLENAVTVGVQARMRNTGQSCIAAKRFIVSDKIAETFLSMFKKEVESLRGGDPLDSSTQYGPLARIDLAEDVEDQIKRSVSQGAKILSGGHRDQAKLTPTILTNVKPGMAAFDEEVFGPVAAVTIVKSDEEALEMANHTTFGLGASVFTTNKERAKLFIDGIEDGAVFVNALVQSDPRLPFGGSKRSGYGRELSSYGIKEFVNIKTIYMKDH